MSESGHGTTVLDRHRGRTNPELREKCLGINERVTRTRKWNDLDEGSSDSGHGQSQRKATNSEVQKQRWPMIEHRGGGGKCPEK